MSFSASAKVEDETSGPTGGAVPNAGGAPGVGSLGAGVFGRAGACTVAGDPLEFNGLWGFIDKTGKVVIAPEYKTTFGRKSNIGSDDTEDAFHDGWRRLR
jgi:hypothetical protein